MQNKGTILVVDDELLNLFVLITNLENAGYAVMSAEGGAEAWELIQRYPFDVVLLDLVLPDLGGFEILRRMKADENLQHIPVLIITAYESMDDLVECIEIGATDYLTKPFDPAVLHARINASLNIKRLHDMEQAYREQLQLQNAELDAFARTVAHDLKTPLSVIMLAADILKLNYDKKPDDGSLSKIETIRSNALKMNQIIEALLLLASMRHEQPVFEKLDMTPIVEEAINRLHTLEEDYKVSLSLPHSWPTAVGYAPWLEEVWVNYLSNAYKYAGPDPKVELGAAPIDGDQVRFWVKDNGPGIPAHKINDVFREFTRLTYEKAEGHGLGLSIVDRIIRKMGGEVGVESKEGEGCLFWFTLPAS